MAPRSKICHSCTMTEAISYQTKRIDHFGIIAGVCNHIGLANLINSHVTGGKERKVTCGQAVKAMILNALGLSSRPLYLMSEAMGNKPVDILIGEGLKAEDFNDDTLGRALDDLHRTGITGLFHLIAQQAIETYGIDSSELHTDTTTFSLQGKYKPKELDETTENGEPQAETETGDEENREAAVVHVTHGYSKDHRHDLKQVVVTLITTERSNLPMWLEVLDGNSSDKKTFPQTVEAYCKQLSDADEPKTFVMDSAWYSANNLRECPKKAFWISRVPETITQAKSALNVAQDEMRIGKDGYRFYETNSDYGGVSQRWLVVFSPEGYEREKVTFMKRVNKIEQKVIKEWKKVQKQRFSCENDAIRAVECNDFGLSRRFSSAGR